MTEYDRLRASLARNTMQRRVDALRASRMTEKLSLEEKVTYRLDLVDNISCHIPMATLTCPL